MVVAPFPFNDIQTWSPSNCPWVIRVMLLKLNNLIKSIGHLLAGYHVPYLGEYHS